MPNDIQSIIFSALVKINVRLVCFKANLPYIFINKPPRV